MRSTRSAAALALCLALAAGCGKKEDEQQLSPCEQYCGEVSTACPAGSAQAQYPAHGNISCLAYCDRAAAFTLGPVGASAGDTLECRRTHAGLAMGDPAGQCLAAGPSGGDVCGSWCENYCTLALRNCTGSNALFADEASCLATCAGFPTDGAWDHMTDSVQCRLMEAAEAYLNPVEHCPHAAPVSTACL